MKRAMNEQIEKEYVIIDTDPGIDDTMALILAFVSPEIVIEGITIVMGNHNDIDLLARNACTTVELCNYQPEKSFKIYKGACKPLHRDYHGHTAITIHGDNGIGNIKIETSSTHFIDETPASQFIIDTCLKKKKKITIISLGPMTNIAAALIQEPELKNCIKRIVSMGGALGVRGNVSPVAEANIGNDPEAAKIVFASGIDIYLAPLDVTRRVHMDTNFRNELKKLGKIGKFIFDITQHYVDILVSFGVDREIIPVHDSCAIMAVIFPEVFTEVKKLFVDVETTGELTRGMTVADWVGVWKKEPQTTVYLNVDQEKFKKFYLERISMYSL